MIPGKKHWNHLEKQYKNQLYKWYIIYPASQPPLKRVQLLLDDDKPLLYKLVNLVNQPKKTGETMWNHGLPGYYIQIW